jgi:hypothetical protein
MAFFDPNGTFYFTDDEMIRKITPDGNFWTGMLRKLVVQ